jgi:plastocyanin
MFTKFIVVVGAVLLIVGFMSWNNVSAPTDLALDTASTTVPTTEVPATPTPATKPKSATTPTTPAVTATPGAGARTFEKGFYVTTIYLTNAGFEPATIEINKGEEVRFVDKSSGIMSVVADDKTSSLYYRSIKQPSTIQKTSTFQMGLPELGIFNYYNLNGTPRKSGTIIVK